MGGERRTCVWNLPHIQQLSKVGGADHRDVSYNISCVSTGVQANLLDPIGVASDIQAQVEVKGVPTSKD